MSEGLAGMVVKVVDELSRAVFGPAGYSNQTVNGHTPDVVLSDYRRHGAR